MNLSEDEIRQALIEAYEAGWRGCLELKQEYVEQVMEKFHKTHLEYAPKPIIDTTWTVVVA